MISQVFLGGVGAVHFLELPIHPQAVDSDGVRLVDFRFQGGDVLVFHVGIGIDLAAGGGIGRFAVPFNEALMTAVIGILVNSHFVHPFCCPRRKCLRKQSVFFLWPAPIYF